MSLINVSLDTVTRSTKVTIGGQDVSFESVFIDIFDDDVFFNMEQEVPDANGLVTLKRFRLPSKPNENDIAEPLNDAGLVESEGTASDLAAQALARLYSENRKIVLQR